MKLEQFLKLDIGQKLYSKEHDEFVTKAYVLSEIKNRTLKIARSGYPLSGETGYIYKWVIEDLELVNDKKVKKTVDEYLKKKGLYADL